MSSAESESGAGLDLEQIRLRLKEERDRRDSWQQVGDLFGITGQWASQVARGEEDPSPDLRDRMERVLTRPRPVSGEIRSPERQRLARWLEWLADGVRAGLIPVFDTDTEPGIAQEVTEPARPPERRRAEPLGGEGEGEAT